jgi:hypothetical protein
MLKFTEITALVPFSTATGDYTHNVARKIPARQWTQTDPNSLASY